MAHDILIIISRAEALAKNADNTALIEALRDKAITADNWLTANPNHGKAEDVHDWLTALQSELTTTEITMGDCLTAYPL